MTQQYYSLTSPRHWTPYTEGRWSKYSSHTGVLQDDTLAQYLFINCQGYVLRTSIDLMKENGFKLTKERSRRYPAQKITDADYTGNIALLTNTSVSAESLLPNMERTAGGIGLHCSTMWVGCQSRWFLCLFWRETRQRILGHEISPYPEVGRGREWELTTRPSRGQLAAGQQRGKQQRVGGWTAEKRGSMG